MWPRLDAALREVSKIVEPAPAPASLSIDGLLEGLPGVSAVVRNAVMDARMAFLDRAKKPSTVCVCFVPST